MLTAFARLLLLFVALALAVPESIAKRTGGGRSAGRQSAAVARSPSTASPGPARNQQAQAPATPPQPSPPASTPTTAQRELPPHAPERALPRHAGSPWGGFLGGALIGLGLGSLLGDGDNATVNRSEGNSGTGTAAAGPGNDAQASQSTAGGLFGLGFLAALVIYLVRRARRRMRQ